MEEVRNIRILLIEDNPGDARLMQEAFSEAKGIEFFIEWADTLNDGLKRFKEHEIDVILLDLSLPDSQGIDTFIKLQMQAQGVPILVLTGLYDEALAVKAVHEGAQDYLIKGQVTGDSLIRSIRYAIERQKIEEELRRSNNFNQSILKALPFGMDIVDEEGNILYLSDNLVSQVGGGVLGKKCWLVYKDDEVQCYSCSLKSGIKLDQINSIEAEGVLGGKIFQIMHIGIMYEGKKAVLEIFNDITERKRLEQIKSDFVALVSHQLKTPIGEMRGFIDNMLNGLTGTINDKQRQYLKDMQTISSRSYHLISDLLNVSTIERGVMTASIRPVPLREILTASIDDYRVEINKKGLSLVLEGIDQNLIVEADKEKMVEAVSNVLDNALKFTSRGSITIRAKAENGFGIIEIEDTGRGIPIDTLNKIFTRQQTLSGGPSTESGTGLGLYIAKSFMALQKGDIVVESREDEGSKFIFKIPLSVV